MGCLNAGPERLFGSCRRPPRVSGGGSQEVSLGSGELRPAGDRPVLRLFRTPVDGGLLLVPVVRFEAEGIRAVGPRIGGGSMGESG